MADHTATQITTNHESWTDFLKIAARLYKYPYHEQLGRKLLPNKDCRMRYKKAGVLTAFFQKKQ